MLRVGLFCFGFSSVQFSLVYGVHFICLPIVLVLVRVGGGKSAFDVGAKF